MADDIRSAEYQAAHPELREAMEFVARLDPENFLRFVRITVEMREMMHQSAHKIASQHYRLTTEKKS